ncbi:phosphate ABC transporter substrate-binding protein PstS [uncultured Friedmanniella sp.]|uniref:phosphate ABC transporter substrate-binding protein PstS n=1 Tax=uncultured Friedmanniella sp. TaxID=335381 RepID=UPI0035CBA21D
MTLHQASAKPYLTSRVVKLAAVLALGTLSLAACGSDPVAPTSSAAPGGSTSSSGGSTSASGLACPAGSLAAEGSSAQNDAITETIASYNAECGDKATIEYNPTGSGAGIKSFYNGLVDFAGSDSALKTEEKDGVVESEKAEERCEGNPAWNLPMVVGPIAFAYNVDGVDKLTLNAEVLAEIFNGTIKTWNDPKIAKLNDGVTLPSDPITVFFRSDESGTTENATKYLQAAGNGAWKDEPAKAWTGTGEGKNKSAGVAEGVTGTKNSISYMEWSYAKTNNLKIAQLDGGKGAVELTGESVGKAVDEAEIKGSGNDLSLSLKYTGNAEGAYPALLVTYEIVCSKGLAADKTAIVKDFLGYFASDTAQQSLEDLGYAPLPTTLLTKVKASVDAIS